MGINRYSTIRHKGNVLYVLDVITYKMSKYLFAVDLDSSLKNDDKYIVSILKKPLFGSKWDANGDYYNEIYAVEKKRIQRFGAYDAELILNNTSALDEWQKNVLKTFLEITDNGRAL